MNDFFTEFLFEYGLFTAKTITFFVIVILSVAILAILSFSKGNKDKESIEIEKINEKFDALQEALEQGVLSKEELKALEKERKKKAKAEKKGEKNPQEAESGDDNKKRKVLFVTRFFGDVEASAVSTLRESITAILSIATPEDEVVVILESSGGYVHNYGLAASQLKRIRDRQVKLTVIVDLVAASGGYLMACVANQILAAPFAVIGSIGVFAQIPNFNRLLDKHDVDIEQHTAGEYKANITMLGKVTDKARKKFKEELEDTHQLFKEFVLEHRPELDINRLATGEHWYGKQALQLKLIDAIQTSDDYLMQHKDDTDIFEVSYVIEESIKERLMHWLESSISKTFAKLLRKQNFI
ncbi:MAG: protease SohB [Gammaproteobacteria bacterium]